MVEQTMIANLIRAVAFHSPVRLSAMRLFCYQGEVSIVRFAETMKYDLDTRCAVSAPPPTPSF